MNTNRKTELKITIDLKNDTVKLML